MSLERWHELHDEHVREHGDDARPEAVARADARADAEQPPDAYVYEPGARWLVSDPSHVQVWTGAYGLHGSALEARLMQDDMPWGDGF